MCHADENHIGHEWYAMAPFVPGGKSNGKTLSSFHIAPSYRTHFSLMSCSAGGSSPPARPMVPHRSGGLSLTDGALVFRSSDWISGADRAEFSCAKAPNVVTRSMECHKRNMTFSYFCPVLGKQETASYFDAGRTGNEEELKTKSGFPVIASNLHTNNESSHTP